MSIPSLFGPRCWIEGRWPFRPKPQDDELLTSYLARAAQGVGMKPITLLNAMCGSRQSLLCQDLDNFVPEGVLVRIAEGGGLPPERVLAMTLTEHAGRLNATHLPLGRKTWILATTIFANERQRPGLQYCSLCLRDDPIPYFRRGWRLAFSTVCTRHGIMLRDRCPHCEAFIHIHRSPSLRHCFACGLDYTRAIKDPPADPRSIDFQRGLEKALETGWIEVAGRPVYSPLWFIVVRRFCALAVNGKWTKVYLEEVARRYGGDASPLVKAAPKDPIEYLSTVDRHRVLDVARRVLENYPSRLITVCHTTRVTRSRVIQDMSYVPFVLDEVLKEHLDDKPYQASEEEVAAAAAWMRRHKGLATYKDLKAHCGESRAAIYRHMDYTRRIATPSVWRTMALKVSSKPRKGEGVIGLP